MSKALLDAGPLWLWRNTSHDLFIYRYADGLPIVVDRDLWPRLMGLEGDSTVDALVRAHAEWTTELWVDQLPPRRMTSARDLAEVAPRR